jgi:mannose-6-phosphate isomerase class I
MVDENGTVPFNVQAAFHPQVSRLVECEKFVWDRWEFDSPQSAGGDDRCHIITILKGAVEIEGDPSGSVLSRGGTALLPASLGSVPLRPQGWTPICRNVAVREANVILSAAKDLVWSWGEILHCVQDD